MLASFDELAQREWLETDGFGGYAGGTVVGAGTRRYHGLLVAATRAPVGRMALVHEPDVTLVDGAGHAHALATHLFQSAGGRVVHPDGWRRLAGFTTTPWPTWRWQIDDLAVEREVVMPHRRGATVVRWRVTGGAARLVVRLLLSGRDHHALMRENPVCDARAVVSDKMLRFTPYPGVPTIVVCHDGAWRAAPDWWRRFDRPVERARGLDDTEDLWTPGELAWHLADGDAATVVLATDEAPLDVTTALADERARRDGLARRFATLHPDADHVATRLARAADQFLVARGDGATVIAGYPWFTDWGRDTFIALPGLTLATGRRDVARALLEAFATHVDGGMIPNRFPDEGEAPEYNTVDAALWYVLAAAHFADDGAFVRATLWPAVRAIVDGYRAGTRYGIGVDGRDGLVRAGAPGVALTWMDAVVDGHVVTPRRGKPVEIQALWIRALAVAARLARAVDEHRWAAAADALAARARTSLGRRFWNDAAGTLYDVVDGEHGDDPRLRPNALYALALDPPAFPAAQARSALAAIERALVVPVGVRTLDPDDADYVGHYGGDRRARDDAYHQGTAWPHLLGVYADAVRIVCGARVGRRIVDAFAPRLDDGCVGQVAEIFDGDAPHHGRGCFAQAWAVAELLRIAVED